MGDCIVDRQDGVMLIRFNRPHAMNAMGGTLLTEMVEAIREGQNDDRVRAFVVTGEGRAWCAGADLTQTAAAGALPAEQRVDVRARSLDAIGEAGRIILMLYNCDKPTIAAVNGVTVGGGFGLCSAFDIRIASDQARFSTIFIKRALAPDYGLSWFLPRLVGPQAAADMFFTGRMVGAEEALRLGLVAKVVPHEALVGAAMDYAGALAKQPPVALTLTRRALHWSPVNTLEKHLEYEWTNQRTCLASAEFQEGVRAFVEKREPDYTRF